MNDSPAGSNHLDQLLDDVRRAAQRIIDAQDHLTAMVVRAREAGVSYARIGQTLGVTRQAAWERFKTANGRTAAPEDEG